MARGQKDKLYRNFSKGLITEAGFLTYPEDSSIDELNTIIYRKGNRSRRLGMDFEEGSVGVTLPDLNADTTVAEYFWRAPAEKSSLNFVVVQEDHYLQFFDASVTPLEAGKKSFGLDLMDQAAPGATMEDVRSTRVSMAGGKGYLFVASEFLDPFTLIYDPVTDSISAIKVQIMIRDFDGVNDGLPNDAEPSTLSNEHLYNLRNQGWVPPGSASVQTSLPGTAPSTGAETTPLGEGGGAGGTTEEYYDPYTGTNSNWNEIGTVSQ